MTRSKFLPFACGLLIGTVLTGCGPIPLAARSLERVDEASRMRKAASLRTWEAGGKGRESTVKTAEIRTGLLLRWDTIDVSSERTARGDLHWNLQMKGDHGSVASAVPITEDGYYLTAAHCVKEASPTLVSLSRELKMEKRPVRVIWRGDGTGDSPDLAVIHVALKPAMPFRLAGSGDLQSGSAVAVTGWSGLAHSQISGSSAGGRLLLVSHLRYGRSGVVWRSVRHDVPLGSGDSGGPLITTNGRCAGINTKIVVSGLTLLKAWSGSTGPAGGPLPGYQGEAILPDPDWLRGVIEADRRLMMNPKKNTRSRERPGV